MIFFSRFISRFCPVFFLSRLLGGYWISDTWIATLHSIKDSVEVPRDFAYLLYPLVCDNKLHFEPWCYGPIPSNLLPICYNGNTFNLRQLSPNWDIFFWLYCCNAQIQDLLSCLKIISLASSCPLAKQVGITFVAWVEEKASDLTHTPVLGLSHTDRCLNRAKVFCKKQTRSLLTMIP